MEVIKYLFPEEQLSLDRLINYFVAIMAYCLFTFWNSDFFSSKKQTKILYAHVQCTCTVYMYTVHVQTNKQTQRKINKHNQTNKHTEKHR